MDIMRRVFVSYSSDDRYRAAHIVQALRDAGVSTFWDQDLMPRQDFRAVIAHEIRRADCTIVLWSRSSVRSAFVADEADLARKVGNYTPTMLDRVQPPMGLRGEQFLWLDKWYGDVKSPFWQALLSTVHGALVHKPGTPMPVDAFSDGPQGPTMVALEITNAGMEGICTHRLAVGVEFVTRDQFVQWPEATELSPLLHDHPYAAYATPSFREAVAYCEWLTKAFGRRYHLLSNADFEAVASTLEQYKLNSGLAVGPSEGVQSLKMFVRAMWTWTGKSQIRQVGEDLIETASALGGCWFTPPSETTARATFTANCRLPFVGLRIAADL
jgi:TIR domain